MAMFEDTVAGRWQVTVGFPVSLSIQSLGKCDNWSIKKNQCLDTRKEDISKLSSREIHQLENQNKTTRPAIRIWLVVSTPLKNDVVKWDDEIPNIWKHESHVPNHQPAMEIFSRNIILGKSSHLGLSENRLNPIVPNGFADHYPYEKWL